MSQVPAPATPLGAVAETAAAAPAPERGRRRAAAVELALIALALTAAWALSPAPRVLPLGTVLCYAAVVILGQGLLRDLARLAFRGRPSGPVRKLPCLCAESSLGLLLLGAGAALLLGGIAEPVALTRPRVTLLAAGLLGLGFVARDYVLVLRREPDHGLLGVGASAD